MFGVFFLISGVFEIVDLSRLFSGMTIRPSRARRMNLDFQLLLCIVLAVGVVYEKKNSKIEQKKSIRFGRPSPQRSRL